MAEIDVVHILHAECDRGTGTVICQMGDAKSGEVVDAAAVLFGQCGLISVPPAPTPGEAGAEAVVVKTGDADLIIAARDARSSGTAAGLVTMGETALYPPGAPAAAVLLKNDASINLLTTHDGTKTGKNVNFSVHPTEGARFDWPYGFWRVESDALSFFHSPSGASLAVGGATFTGAFAPLNAFGSYATIHAHLVRINGSIIHLGTEAGVPEPVAKALSTVAVISSMAATIEALSGVVAILAGVQNGNTGAMASPAGVAAAALLTAATTAMVTAVGSAPVTISSASTSTT